MFFSISNGSEVNIMILNGIPYIEYKESQPVFRFGRKKLAAFLTAGTMVALLGSPFAFAEDTTIIGNGSNSINTVISTDTQTQTVSQTNTADTDTTVTSNANSGNNQANGNTGGSVIVAGGDATNDTLVDVSTGGNTATVNGCGCENGAATVIAENGTDSTNTVSKSKTRTSVYSQGSTSTTGTGITTRARSGRNRANNNTGDGTSSVSVISGNAGNISTTVVTTASNELTVGP